VYSQAFGRNLQSVHVHDEVVEAEMLEEVWVRVRRSSEIGVSKHLEEQPFGQGTQHKVVYRHRLGACPVDEGLERNSCHVISGVYLLQGSGVSQLDGRRSFHVSHVLRAVQELEESAGVGLGAQDVKVVLGFREHNLELYAWQEYQGHVEQAAVNAPVHLDISALAPSGLVPAFRGVGGWVVGYKVSVVRILEGADEMILRSVLPVRE
jgi:hypothetical protein